MLSHSAVLSGKFFSVLFAVLALLGLHSTAKPSNPQQQTISQQTTPVMQEQASTTASVSPATTTPKQKTAQTEAPKPKPAPAPKPAPPKTAATPSPKQTAPPIQTAASSPLSGTELDARVRGSLVNILCTTAAYGGLEPISGTGVIISASGLVLTNAHIGQYFLLKDYLEPDYLTCIARIGSPAATAYSLALLYIPPKWVTDNANQITADMPLGTGENDFALLKITGPAQAGMHMPATFVYLPPDASQNAFTAADSFETGGYPAGFLGTLSINQSLYLTTTIDKLHDVYTFATSTIDLLSLGGSILAQHGVSGGAVASLEGKLKALVVTTTEAPTTGERDLRAITVSHINSRLIEFTSFSLKDFMDGNADGFLETYASLIRPSLTDLLEAEIKKHQTY